MATTKSFERNRMHRASPSEFVQELPATPERTSYSLLFIEFDDQGDLWDTEQLFTAIEHIRQKNREHQYGLYTVLFVHGWKNNASPANEESGALSHFKRTVEEWAVSARTHRGEAAPHLVAVYCAWRGLSLDIPFLKDLTFWNRKMTATRVAGEPFTVVLSEVMYTTKEHPLSKCALLGHSFGGLILERAISHALISLLSMNRDTCFEVPWDILCLINPAGPALTSRRLMQFLDCVNARTAIRDAEGNIREVDAPLLVSMTSEADLATKLYFPVGQALSEIFHSFRHFSDQQAPTQRRFASRTPGHLKYVHTHQLSEDGSAIRMERLPGSTCQTPYWIMQLPRSISGGHSDIFGEKFNRVFNHIGDLNDIYNPNSKLLLLKGSFDRPKPRQRAVSAPPE